MRAWHVESATPSSDCVVIVYPVIGEQCNNCERRFICLTERNTQHFVGAMREYTQEHGKVWTRVYETYEVYFDHVITLDCIKVLPKEKVLSVEVQPTHGLRNSHGKIEASKVVVHFK